MKRTVTAVIILFLIISYSFSAAVIIKKENSELLSMLDGIKAHCENNDKASAEKAAGEFEKAWFSYARRMAVFINDQKLSELDSSAAKLRPYAEEANDELEAELQNISRQLELIYKKEIPYWYNLL